MDPPNCTKIVILRLLEPRHTAIHTAVTALHGPLRTRSHSLSARQAKKRGCSHHVKVFIYDTPRFLPLLGAIRITPQTDQTIKSPRVCMHDAHLIYPCTDLDLSHLAQGEGGHPPRSLSHHGAPSVTGGVMGGSESGRGAAVAGGAGGGGGSIPRAIAGATREVATGAATGAATGGGATGAATGGGATGAATGGAARAVMGSVARAATGGGTTGAIVGECTEGGMGGAVGGRAAGGGSAAGGAGLSTGGGAVGTILPM